MNQPFTATDAGFALDFLDRMRYVIQQAERGARARMDGEAARRYAGGSSVDDAMTAVLAAEKAEAAANNYELRLMAGIVELAEVVRDEIRRAVHEAIAASGRGVAEHHSPRPSEPSGLDTSVESPTPQVMNEAARAGEGFPSTEISAS